VNVASKNKHDHKISQMHRDGQTIRRQCLFTASNSAIPAQHTVHADLSFLCKKVNARANDLIYNII
jgi:hypothetical protein